MKVSQQQLRNIILQEVSRVLGEGPEEEPEKHKEFASVEDFKQHLIKLIDKAQQDKQDKITLDITLDIKVANQIRHVLSAETYSQQLQKSASEEARTKKTGGTSSGRAAGSGLAAAASEFNIK